MKKLLLFLAIIPTASLLGNAEKPQKWIRERRIEKFESKYFPIQEDTKKDMYKMTESEFNKFFATFKSITIKKTHFSD